MPHIAEVNNVVFSSPSQQSCSSLQWQTILCHLAQDEPAIRNKITAFFPGDPTGIPLDTLCREVAIPLHYFKLTGILFQPTVPSEIIAIPISSPDRREEPRAVLGFSYELAHRMVDLALGRPSAHPQRSLFRIEQGSLLYALDRLAGDWLAAGGDPFAFRGIFVDGSQIAHYLGGTPTYEAQVAIHGSVINAPMSLWFSEIPTGHSKPRSYWRSPVPWWQVSMRMGVGWSRVQVAEAQQLTVGDLIVLDELSHPEGQPTDTDVVITSGNHSIWGKLCDARHIRIHTVSSKGDAMNPSNTQIDANQPIPATLHTPAPAGPESMEIIIQVEVGEIKLSVEQAASLIPGRILRLDREIDSTVVLRVGDHCIGHGTLVDWNGEFAVEITKIV
jgi:type III secretion system YscQ/HrcQ family protein